MRKNRENLLDQGIVLLFLIVLEGYLPTARSSDRVICLAALLLLLLRTVWLVAKRELRFAMDVNLLIYLLVFLWGLLSCLWGKNLWDFRTYAMVSFPIVVCSVVCLNAYIGQRIEPHRFLHLLILAGILAGIRYCAYTDWSSLSSDYYLRGSFARLLDQVTNYNNYTMVLSVPCVIAMYYAIVEHRRKDILPALILVGIILMGGSRKNIITMPLIAIVFSLFSGNGVKKAKTMLILLAAVAFGIYLVQTVPALSQIRSSIEGMLSGFGNAEESKVDGSTEQRLYLMKQGIRVWVEHPFLGVGWNSYRYYNDANLYAHNNYVELLASLGSVGFLLYYSMYLRAAYLFVSAFLHHTYRKEDVLILGFSAAMLLMEIGAITLYGKERLILLLVMFYWHSYVTGQKTYQFTLK